MKTKQDLYEFLNGYGLGVISTITEDGRPNAAIVGFGQTKDLEILIGTDNTSRKYHNLQHDTHVSFTVGGNTPETIQYEGTARELAPNELHLVEEYYWEKNPHAKAHHRNPNQRYFIITPLWIRYTNVRSQPWDITELSFDIH